MRTNADRLRSASDEEIFKIIYRLMDQAAACPECFKRTGKQRLKIWLSLNEEGEKK